MASGIEKCPYCGGNILKGAMKCPGCGKLLTTAEQQQEAIIRHQESYKKTNTKGIVIKIVVILIVIALAYRYYEEIASLIDRL